MQTGDSFASFGGPFGKDDLLRRGSKLDADYLGPAGEI